MKRRCIQILLWVCMAVLLTIAIGAADPETGYLTFSSETPFTLKTVDGSKYWNGTLAYSTDAKAWTEWTGAEISSSAEGKLYLRGTSNTSIMGNHNRTRYWVLTGDKIACTGNIETLLDYATVLAGEHPPMDAYCFSYLFYDCTSLVTAPALPAVNLTNRCYEHLFEGCSSLTTAPELPATNLAEGCYSVMFGRCSSLTTAPVLPATTLAVACYEKMFGNCSSLTTPPALPATVLTYGCYDSIFYDCTSLTTAPVLPATVLANNCYSMMFYGCTSLTTAPELPATTLKSSCYSFMFGSCSSLTTAPELPATTLAPFCYKSMFVECINLTTAPELPATTMVGNCYESMFYGCSSLTTVPELPATTMAGNCYAYMFSGCTSLTTTPKLPAISLLYANGCYEAMFKNCSSLTTIPELPATSLETECYREMFAGCANVYLSDVQDEYYFQEWCIPSAVEEVFRNWNKDMFKSTGGTFQGEPTPGKAYYMAHIHDQRMKGILTEDDLPTTADGYALWDELLLTADWTVPVGETTICLNGHSLTLNGHTITVPTDSTLTLCDCGQTDGKATVDMTFGGQFAGDGAIGEMECRYTVVDEIAGTTTSITDAEDYIVNLITAPQKIEVYIGEKKLTADEDYTYDTTTGVLTIYHTAITGNATIKAVVEPDTGSNWWEKVPHIVPFYPTVTFETNGGTTISPITRAFGTAINLPRYKTAKEGYTFTGWYLDADCTMPAKNGKLTGDITLYAGWYADTTAE